jgi:hypothetical protein
MKKGMTLKQFKKAVKILKSCKKDTIVIDGVEYYEFTINGRRLHV